MASTLIKRGCSIALRPLAEEEASKQWFTSSKEISGVKVAEGILSSPT